MSGIGIFNSGSPIFINQDGDTLNVDSEEIRPNLVSGQDPTLPASERTIARWFNTAAFARATITYGTSPRNPVVGPGRKVVDISLAKAFGVRAGQPDPVPGGSLQCLQLGELEQPERHARATPTSGSSAAPPPRARCSCRSSTRSDCPFLGRSVPVRRGHVPDPVNIRLPLSPLSPLTLSSRPRRLGIRYFFLLWLAQNDDWIDGRRAIRGEVPPREERRSAASKAGPASQADRTGKDWETSASRTRAGR